MKHLFDNVSEKCSKITTRSYSTSFSFGIKLLHKTIRQDVYNIYGFVRFADEIVDSFHDYDKKILLDQFKKDTYNSIEAKISLNPILNSFQQTVNNFNIDLALIDLFFKSMEMDLNQKIYNEKNYKDYIYGSAEVVGLMCLHIFLKGDNNMYNQLKPFAMSLGSAFQKVNFLRDLNDDVKKLGRVYFPNIQIDNFSDEDKKIIELDINNEFKNALVGIKKLPVKSRGGVYLAYIYYYALFRKICAIPSKKLLNKRVRINNLYKIHLMCLSNCKNYLNLI